ncbi:MAG TPA: methyltransferase domain-containing protein [Chryseolinea sp.]|nr:methyltransferase domain-containing protein [Chryseolinea sp.]
MFAEESIWIRDAIAGLESSEIKQVGNIGSSSLVFRTKIQPHIHNNIIAPMEKGGTHVVNIDLKEDEGVDVIGDITSLSFGDQFSGQFDLVLCTNLLEHVVDINLVVQNLVKSVKNTGYILITVPYKYRLHYDPIDNGFRPTPNEIAGLFDGNNFSIKASKIISIKDIEAYRIRKSRYPFWGHRERLLYFFGKRYKVSGILICISK